MMDFNRNLLTRCSKISQRAFLSWIAGMGAFQCPKPIVGHLSGHYGTGLSQLAHLTW